MNLLFRRRVPISRNSWANVSRSGVSVSRRVGRVTLNSRGGARLRLGKGFSLKLW